MPRGSDIHMGPRPVAAPPDPISPPLIELGRSCPRAPSKGQSQPARQGRLPRTGQLVRGQDVFRAGTVQGAVPGPLCPRSAGLCQQSQCGGVAEATACHL